MVGDVAAVMCGSEGEWVRGEETGRRREEEGGAVTVVVCGVERQKMEGDGMGGRWEVRREEKTEMVRGCGCGASARGEEKEVGVVNEVPRAAQA